MDDNYGRCAIIENGSPLFTGGTASGESQIRRWLLESDLIEAIIQLPTDLFYNTGITTYIWIVSKNKRQARKGKVQLIDASGICHQLRKALGNKRFEITREDRNTITELYTEFQPGELSKIYNNTEFIYREYTVMQPLQRSYAIDDQSIWRLKQKGMLSSIYDARKIQELESLDELSHKDELKLRTLRDGEFLYTRIFEALEAAKDSKKYLSPSAFAPVLLQVLDGVTDDKNILDKIAEGLSVMDKTAEIQKDKKGNIIYDKETKDTEIVKFEESIDDYMEREVLPHVPDAKAFFEENLTKKTPVIKTGAEILFSRYYYKYQEPISSEKLINKFNQLQCNLDSRIKNLFK